MSLDFSGFSSFFRESFEALNEPSLAPARVLRGEPAPFRVQTEEGETLAALGGRARERQSTAIVAGDWVALDPAGKIVRHVLPRRTSFVRRAAGRAAVAQVVAANFDIVFIVMGLDGDFNLHRLERYLSLVHASGAEGVVLLTKASLASDTAYRLSAATLVARQTPVHAIDVVAGVDADIPSRYLGEGVTCALVGSSGVGKSTLLNHLLGRERARTLPTRRVDDKGQHTTTHRELYSLASGGCVIDTPGMRELALWGDESALATTFDDVAVFAEQCRFRDCRHEGEPDCAVRRAVETGELDADRSEAMRKLEKEMIRTDGQRKAWERRAGERRFGKITREAIRQKYGRGGS
jgi:ribosome biogenesis GTPase